MLFLITAFALESDCKNTNKNQTSKINLPNSFFNPPFTISLTSTSAQLVPFNIYLKNCPIETLTPLKTNT